MILELSHVSYSVIACDRTTKDVHDCSTLNINCSSFVVAVDVYEVL